MRTPSREQKRAPEARKTDIGPAGCSSLGDYVVVTEGVCGGRPTFRGTRVEVRVILELLRAGATITEILRNYPRISRKAIEEAISLATQAFTDQYARNAA
jgi:uncharacterized protein (DUF433 family)